MPYKIDLGYSDHSAIYKKNLEKIRGCLKENGKKPEEAQAIREYFESFIEIKRNLPRFGAAKGISDISEIKSINNAYSMNIASSLQTRMDVKGDYKKDIAETIDSTFLNSDKQNRTIIYTLTDILIKGYIDDNTDSLKRQNRSPLYSFLSDIYETTKKKLDSSIKSTYLKELENIKITYKGKEKSIRKEEVISKEREDEDQTGIKLEKIVSEVRLKDIGGLKTAKKEIEKIALAYKNPDIFERNDARFFSGMLLYGPPGTGKTMIAKAVAGELDVDLIPLSISDVVSKYFGDSEKMIKEYFRQARECKKGVLFIDEIDALAPARGRSDSMASDRIISTLLTEMDGIKDRKELMVLGATNRIDVIDPALKRPGRFSKLIEISLPDKDTREDIFRIKVKRSLSKEKTYDKLFADDIDYKLISSITEGFSGADIEEIIERSKEEKSFSECKGKRTYSIGTKEIISEIERYERHKGKDNEHKIKELILAGS